MLNNLVGTGDTSNIVTNSLEVSGITTVGFITATDVWVSGAVTATNYYGDEVYVTGVSTFAGITTVTGTTLFSKQLSVSGFSTYIGVATYKSNVFIDGTLTAGAIDGGTY